ncbi:unnamed protein product [Angiostrongylus costaricensis]|uniref:DAGKc domain-containing protein n=1 Tax=Angiostrongylus costaricensis TaxID=334426 RepID=A0A158PGR2_ANGCS|nr:unnamed protein product [Angiostrongylus costaricensis]
MVTSFRNGKIRAAYARQARKYGAATVSAEERPRRVTVLVNVTSNERSCYDDFVKNALPLLHLAGLQVDVIKSDSESQMETLAAAVDTQEADAIYVVGGDGTLGRVVTGILQHRESSVLPIGVFPGGYDNLSLKRLVPDIFESSRDVRRMCESAMALIEDERRYVNAFEITVVTESHIKSIYSVGDVGAGWFRHIEERRRKLWYLGPLKRRWAYLWEMLKHSPVDMEVKLQYEESCSGCRTCRSAVLFEPPTWRWWHILTGPPRYPEHETKKDYSHIVNDNCGQIREVLGNIRHLSHWTQFSSKQIRFQDTACLRVRMGGEDAGRYGIIADGWKRCSANRVGASDNEQFYSTDLLAKAISLTFLKIPVHLC